VPEWLLERFMLGELPSEELRELGRRIEADSGLRERLAELERSNAEILTTYTPPDMARAIERAIEQRERVERVQSVRASAGTPSRPSRWAVAGGLVTLAGAAAMVMLVVQPAGGPETDGPRPEVIRLKGGGQLIIHRVAGDGSQRAMEEGSRVDDGDVLQVGYRSGGARYGVIASVDGRGTITVHYPDGRRAGELSAGGVVSLAHSYELDDAPGYEQFFFVTSEQPFDVAVVTQALGAWTRTDGGELALPAGFEQTSLQLRKGAP
jgi:hypothetical protein